MFSTTRSIRWLVAAAVVTLALGACDDAQEPVGPIDDPMDAKYRAPAPADLVTASLDGASLEFWPYTTDDFGTRIDPVNLLFVGDADPRAIRATLLSVDADHSGFPVPFACTWEDVPEGGIQATYATGTGWTGSAIQLACGDYSTLRFHLRLFAAGDWTIGSAHVEFLIPGTTEHQVLSWEVAEQFVLYDLVRSGFAAPVGVAPINDAPAYRTIPALIVGLLASDPTDPELAALLAIACPPGTPWPCDGSADVGILTDGQAAIVNMTGSPEAEAGSFKRTQTVQFNQVIPKPFCIDLAFPAVQVTGPIEFREHWVLTPSNNYIANFRARGTLNLTPLDPATGETGSTYRARVDEKHRAMFTDHQNTVSQVQMQVELPPSAPFHGRLRVEFGVGSHGMTSHSASLVCGG